MMVVACDKRVILRQSGRHIPARNGNAPSQTWGNIFIKHLCHVFILLLLLVGFFGTIRLAFDVYAHNNGAKSR